MKNELYVITVVMNDEYGFQNTRSSLISQIETDFHWIVIDSSTEPLHRHVDISNAQEIKVHYEWVSPNGIYEAMNQALKNLTMGWAVFLNAGDVFKENSSTKLICEDIGSVTDEIGVIGYAVEHVTPAGNLWHISCPRVIPLTETNYSIAEINHQGFVARISALHDIGGFDTSLRFAADGKAMDQIVHKWGFVLSDRVTTKFVIGGRSSSNYSKLLREIESYRPALDGIKLKNLRNILKVLKNSLRMKVFWASSYFPSIEDWILRLRNFL